MTISTGNVVPAAPATDLRRVLRRVRRVMAGAGNARQRLDLYKAGKPYRVP